MPTRDGYARVGLLFSLAHTRKPHPANGRRDGPPAAAEADNGRLPIASLRILAITAVAAFVIGVLIPGLAARHDNVFDADQMLDRVDKKLCNDNRGNPHISRSKCKLLETKADWGDEKGRLLTALMAMPEPVSIQPFYRHIVMYFWPSMYLCLGILLFLATPPDVRMWPAHLRSVFFVTAGIFVFYVGPLWLRNLVFDKPEYGRVVYAYPNWDISRLSFAAQQLNYLIFAFLLAILWYQWSEYFVLRRTELESERGSSGLEATFDPLRLKRLSDTLIHFQLSFALLSAGYLIYTAIFWTQLIREGDWRFLPEAIVVHLLWLASAIIMARPFWITWRRWQLDRIRATCELIHALPPDSNDLDAKLTAVREFRPIGYWNVAAFAVTAMSSLAGPLIQVLLK